MTKEITKAIILQEIEDRFKFREFTPAKFLFDETVIPVYDIGEHLQKWKIRWIAQSITSGPSGFIFFTVPQEKRWKIRGYNVVFMAAGAYKVTGLYIRRGTSTDIIYLDMVEGQTVSYAVNLPQPAVLNPTDSLFLYVDDYVSTADLRLYIDMIEEEIR